MARTIALDKRVLRPNFNIQGVTAISGKRFKLIFLVLIYVVLKQTIYQQKALDLSFNLAP